MDTSLAGAWAFGLLLMRTGGLVLTAPILSARFVPARVRLGIALVVTVAAYTGSGSPHLAPPAELGPLASAAAAETALGALAGLAARFTLDAALAAGHLASTAMGLGYGALVDPASGAESNAAAELLSISAQAGAVALGIHREAIAWIARSAVAFPPGTVASLREFALRAVWGATGAAALAVRLAFPILGAIMVGHALMAVLGRTAPQLSISSLGFSVTILAGGGAFYLVAPAAAELAARAAMAALHG